MNKKTIIGIMVVVVVVIVITLFVMGNHGGGTAPSQTPSQTQTGQTTSTPGATPAYTSSDDGFSINFPGTPDITETTFVSPSAGTIPLTRYIFQSGSGTSLQYYAVDVYHYPQSYTFPSDYLSGALQIFVSDVNAKYPGSKLTIQTPTQLLGDPAIAGVVTTPTSAGQGTNYVTITTKGQNAYGIDTYGLNQNDYDSFVNSFLFTQ